MLKPGGRLAGYLIHTSPGLTHDETRRAVELGPPESAADAPPDELTRRAGFTILRHEDVTDQFRHACQSLLDARTRLESEIRRHEGNEVFDEECARKTALLGGIREGLLRRSLVVALAG